MTEAKKYLFGASVLALVLCAVWGACPNACNGNGVCGDYDMCQCWPQYSGADCSERECPAGISFVTTLQGDLNADGTLSDNTGDPLAGGATCSMAKLSPTVTFSADQSGHFDVGDGILVGGEKFTIITKDTTTAFTLSAPRSFDSVTTISDCYKFQKTQLELEGSWEMYQPGSANEGHVSMRCSNQGTCDKKTGMCKCFPGYDGTACQRTVCPNDCSGHGTCEKVSELIKKEPVKLACKVSGAKGTKTLLVQNDVSTADCVAAVANNEYIVVDGYPTPIQVASKTALVTSNAATFTPASFTTTAPLPIDFPVGTEVYHVPTYGLWDADMNRACKCDPLYTGYDCSSRKCPKGDDPLTKTNNVGSTQVQVSQQYETQMITIGARQPQVAAEGTFKLKFTDMYGEVWTTAAIAAPLTNAGADAATNVKNALKQLPNDVVQDVTVSGTVIASKGVRVNVKFNGGAATMPAAYTGNSGDLPSMVCDGSGLYETVKTTGVVTASADPTNLGLTAAITLTGTFAATLLSVGDMVTNGGTAGVVTVTSLTYDGSNNIVALTTTADLGGTTVAIDVVRKIYGNVPCTVSDVDTLLDSAGAEISLAASNIVDSGSNVLTATVSSTGTQLDLSATPTADITANHYVSIRGLDGTEKVLQVTAGTGTGPYTITSGADGAALAIKLIGATQPTSQSLTLSATADNLAVGDKLKLYKADFRTEVVTISSITAAAITTVEAMSDFYFTGSVHFYGKGTTESADCSGRGLCDTGTGTCKCFKGYTMDDCSKQNALAA